MRFNLPPAKDPFAWYRWFAWYPVTVGRRVVWLEPVERRFECDRVGHWWEYREVTR